LPRLIACEQLIQTAKAPLDNNATASTRCLDCVFEACTRSFLTPNATCADVAAISDAWWQVCADRNVDAVLHKLPTLFNDSCSLFANELGSARRCSNCSCAANATVGAVVGVYVHRSCGSCCGPESCFTTLMVQRCSCSNDNKCVVDMRREDEHVACGQVCAGSLPGVGSGFSPSVGAWPLLALVAAMIRK